MQLTLKSVEILLCVALYASALSVSDRENSSPATANEEFNETDVDVGACSIVPHPFSWFGLHFVKELSINEGAGLESDNTITPSNTMKNQEEIVSQGEFKCRFFWDDVIFLKLKNKILDWMRNRQKSFIRFTVPVMGYTNPHLSMYEDSNALTWVWVMNKYSYMLHYPQNFARISTGTMGIITQDWALNYKQNVPVSLGNFSIDIDDSHYQYESNVGHCDSECVEVNKSCGIGKYELSRLLTNITESKEYVWEWICLQLPYMDIITVTGSHPNFVTPNVLYYMLFLKKLFMERPLLDTHERDNFIHYQCYKREELSVSKPKELLEKYAVIPFLASALWLFVPLLVHYLPSSEVKSTSAFKHEGMFPCHKSPHYFGNCLKKLFCFYSSKKNLVRLRRALFLCAILLSSFELFQLPYCGKFILGIVMIFAFTSLIPVYISKYINPSYKFTLMGWEVPPHLVHKNPNLQEYQLLAAVMQERLYLTVDYRFWDALIRKYCFKMFLKYSWTDSSIIRFIILKPVLFAYGILLFLTSVLVYFSFYFFPPLFFCKEMAVAIFGATSNHNRQPKTSVTVVVSCIHGLCVFSMFLYTMVVIFFWCYAMIECSLFTLMGGAMLPSMAFPYFALVGSLVGAVYSLVHSLHQDYERIIASIISILNAERKFPISKVFEPSNALVRELVKTEESALPSHYTISVVIGTGQKKDLVKHNVVTTFLSRELYDFVVEECHPLRRQVLFIVIQIVAIVFYASIIMWMKNVYHLEDEVRAIITVVSIVAVAFVPNALKFMAYNNYFVKEAKTKNIYFAIIDYFAKLDVKQ